MGDVIWSTSLDLWRRVFSLWFIRLCSSKPFVSASPYSVLRILQFSITYLAGVSFKSRWEVVRLILHASLLCHGLCAVIQGRTAAIHREGRGGPWRRADIANLNLCQPWLVNLQPPSVGCVPPTATAAPTVGPATQFLRKYSEYMLLLKPPAYLPCVRLDMAASGLAKGVCALDSVMNHSREECAPEFA